MILRDPVHGLVSFESDEEAIIEQLMDTPEVQRLRRIRQLGAASMAFPGAEHSRFAHAVGAAFVMKRLIARLRSIEADLPFWQRLTTDRARDALAAALLHDVGHGPFSHLFECVIGTGKHEAWTERIVLSESTGVGKVLRDLDPDMPRRVAALVRGENPLPYLARAVSGTFDVDRCDYLLRDAHATGVRYGDLDLDWLLRSLRFLPTTPEGAPTLAIDGARGLPAIEAFLIARLFMFQQVYLHKAARAGEWMIRATLLRAARTLGSGGSLPGTPAALALAARGEEVPLDSYLTLTDDVLHVAMRAWEDGPDRELAELCRRIRCRELHKTLELFGDQATDEGRETCLALARGVAVARGLDPDTTVGLDVAEVVPFAVGGDPLMVVFAKGPARPLSEVSFLLGRLADEVLARVRLVVAPELREEVVRAVGY